MATATDTLVTTHLGGALGAEFGPEWALLLSHPCPAEAFRAIDVNTKGRFRQYMQAQGNGQFYQVCVGREDNPLDKDELVRPTGKGDIYVLPVVAGSEEAGAKILAAVAIAAITYFTAGAGSAGAAGIFGAAFETAATVGYSMAASLALGGIVQLLTPVPSFNQSNEDSARSHVFQGNTVAISQGSAVPLIYGRMLAVPKPISVSFTAQDQAIVNSFGSMEYEVVEGEGGIIDYKPIPPNIEDSLPVV